MPVYQYGRPNYVPKLMKISLEKISLIQILGDKIFIAIVSKHCKKFNFAISLLFKKAITTVSTMFQPVFTSNFEMGLLCVINPKNIQACLKGSLNVHVKLFPGGLAPKTQAPRPASQLPFGFHVTKNSMSKLTPGYATALTQFGQPLFKILVSPPLFSIPLPFKVFQTVTGKKRGSPHPHHADNPPPALIQYTNLPYTLINNRFQQISKSGFYQFTC